MAPNDQFHTIYRSSTDLLPTILSRHSTEADIRQLETFLDFAPSHPLIHHAVNSRISAILSFVLPGERQISCIAWDGLIWITGEDIIRVVQARFEAAGRPVLRLKEFRGLVVSYLRRPIEGYHKEPDNVGLPYLNIESKLTRLQISSLSFCIIYVNIDVFVRGSVRKFTIGSTIVSTHFSTISYKTIFGSKDKASNQLHP